MYFHRVYGESAPQMKRPENFKATCPSIYVDVGPNNGSPMLHKSDKLWLVNPPPQKKRNLLKGMLKMDSMDTAPKRIIIVVRL